MPCYHVLVITSLSKYQWSFLAFSMCHHFTRKTIKAFKTVPFDAYVALANFKPIQLSANELITLFVVAFCQIKDTTFIHSDKIQLNVHNILHHAELIAILEYLLFIQSINCAIVEIFSDSQSVLKSLSSFSKDPIMTEIQKVYSCLRKRTTINFYWCTGHVNSFGNKAVDNLAKIVKHFHHSTQFSVQT